MFCLPLLLLPFARSAPLSIRATECSTLGTDGPLQVTADCVDPAYASVVILEETEETTPVPHHRVHGNFNGTAIDFNIYFPAKGSWEGRFFQLTYPSQNSTADDQAIAFGADSGAYTVQVAGALGYRHEAAAAKYAREVARTYYQLDSGEQIYGYLYGGSGGSYSTIGAMENTFNVWNGAVAMIQAIPISIPNNWAIRGFGGLVLEPKRDDIINAVSPGGSGDPFSTLDEAQRAALTETTNLGLQLGCWEDFDGVGRNRSFPGGTGLWDDWRLIGQDLIKSADPTYADDFWTQPGYLGTEVSALGDVFRNALVDFNATVKQVTLGSEGYPIQITLNGIPSAIDTVGLEFNILSSNGTEGSFTGALNLNSSSVSIYSKSNITVLASLTNATQLQINNRWYIAAQSYHRHQIPTTRNFYGYDYLRRADGEPIYPQRAVLLGPSIASSSSGSGTHTGNFSGKVFVLDNLVDFDAFPWHAEWYRRQVQQSLGDTFSDSYRLYYEEHADHHMGSIPKEATGRVFDWTNNYQQLIADLSAWVENGTIPPGETQHTYEGGQIILADSAASRLGFQPIVELTVNGGNRTEVEVGENVAFKVHAEMPPSTGPIGSVEWDFKGTGDYVTGTLSSINAVIEAEITYSYNEAQIYLPAVRIAAHREGNAQTPFRRVLNLGRARVTVN